MFSRLSQTLSLTWALGGGALVTEPLILKQLIAVRSEFSQDFFKMNCLVYFLISEALRQLQ